MPHRNCTSLRARQMTASSSLSLPPLSPRGHVSTATRGLSPALLSSLLPSFLPSFLPSYSSSPPLFLDDDDDDQLPIRFSPTANLRNCALQRTTTTHLRAPPPPPSETGLLTDDWWLTLALYSLSHAQVSRWLDPAHVLILWLYAGMYD